VNGAKGTERPRTIFKVWPFCGSKCSVKYAVFVLITTLCVAFSGAEVEYDFVLMTSAFRQYLRTEFSTKQKLISYSGLW